MTWRGRSDSVQFDVKPLWHCNPGPVIGSVTVCAQGVPFGRIGFKVEVTADGEPAPPDKLGDRARRYELAFLSYASKDRPEVLKRVQMLRTLRMRFFQDVLDLEPGDRFEERILSYIDQCDLFLLFWSSSARASEWVMKEVRRARERQKTDEQGLPDIFPVILEGPPPVEPPEELADLHFNDYLLYLG